MKKRIEIDIDQDLADQAARYADNRGLSLSAVVEQRVTDFVSQEIIRELVRARDPDDIRSEERLPLGTRWLGKFRLAERHDQDARYRYLSDKHLR